MLARYKMYRGPRPKDDPLPDGIRQDTRKHRTRHCLHPDKKDVKKYLDNPTKERWREFKTKYSRLLEARFQKDAGRFKALAQLAMKEDVHIGCNCPTTDNPDANHCHTVLALGFMKRKFPKLEVIFPKR